MYYDYRGRIVQTRSTNHLGGFDITYNQYNFTGLVTQSLKEHSTSETLNSPLTEIYTHDYDHAGRLLKTNYKLNQNPDVILNDMNETGAYDEIGRLKKKRRHSLNNDAFLDSEEFDYNIRNWATRLKSGTFEEKLFYNTNLPSIVTPYYNGNIAYSSWTYNGSRYAYTYKYDNLNRLIKAEGYRIVGFSRFPDYGYNELFTYDKQGNILNLQRKKGTTFIDWINPAYNGNQMTFANDYYFSQNQPSVKEYHNFNTSGNDFSYDANGNMTKDLDRKIYTIRYNVLNLPEVIQFKDGHQIINTYDASGQKLSIRYYTVMIPTEVPLSTLQPGDVLNLQYNMDIIDETGTFYVDNKEYSFNGCDPGVYRIDKVYNTEGYANNIAGYYGPNYQYYRKDHLGNTREVWRANTNQTIQKTQYYPSGLPWGKNSGDDIELPINANTRKYNGKEFVEMHGLDEYDSEARWYHPAMMRTTTMDPLAEKYYEMSPYAWCGNNPISFIDPDGRMIVLPKGTSTKNIYTILGNLQKLTNDRLVYSTQKDGTIRIKVASLGKGDKISGTNLIRDLNSSERTVTISIGAAGSGNSESHLRTNSTNGVGTDSEVNFDPTANPSIPTKDPKTGNVSGATRPNQIGLGHELIHAERAMTGTSADGTTTQTYKDANGNTVTKPVRREEVETVGTQGNHKYNENKLRKEQGLNERGAY